MECIREEATKAKQISEEMFATRHDVSGAMKFALKARCLYPRLEGIEQLISVLDVHLAAAEHKDSNGKMDYYRLLQVDPAAEDDEIKKQYRRIALMVHPDKNRSVGAEEAFKLILEASDILSDKRRRAIYDQDQEKIFESDDIWREAADRRLRRPKYSGGSRILNQYFG